MTTLRTEYSFTLPTGYVDPQGTLHREGTMRLSTAADEIEPQRDPRVRDNESYAAIILLARTVVSLGSVTHLSTNTIEGLFVADFSYLQDFYTLINFGDPTILDGLEPGAPLPAAVLESA